MPTLTFQSTLNIEVEDCIHCGVRFGIPADLRASRKRDKKSFYCPNGHPMVYTGQSDADRIQQLNGQLDQERTRRQQAEERIEHESRQRRRVQTRLNNVQKRIKSGVCPCCNRTFKQLAAHMANKHPEFAGKDDSAV